MYIFGRNSVQEALSQAHHGRLEGKRNASGSIEKIFVQYGSETAPMQAIRKIAGELGVPVSVMDKGKFQALERDVCEGPGRAQGVIALIAGFTPLTVGALIEQAFLQQENPLLIALDGINDPHNLGAIIRSAECAGFHGVIVPEQRSAPLSGAAMKTSAGALKYMPVAKTSNLAKALEDTRNAGFEVLALDSEATTFYTEDLYADPIVIVVGSEGDGISKSVRAMCTGSVAIPLHGAISSLNASVAAAVMMFEIIRQRTLTPANQ